MTRLSSASIALVAVALAAGTAADRPPRRAPLTIGGYRVLAADFHAHSSLWSDGALTPWGLVLEAERQGLDAIAVTGHNQTLDGQIARWFARVAGGPIVIAGQEILSDPNHYHLVALGIEERIGFDQPAASAIDAVHRQGGVAIAVHPRRESWGAFDAVAMARLDAAEICHPLIFAIAGGQRELEQFAARGPVAAIGSSDFHGTGRLGLCRTFVFVRDVSAAGILDALRARRTVVFGVDGNSYGDPALIGLARADGRLRAALADLDRVGVLDWISRIAGVLGLTCTAALQIRRAQARPETPHADVRAPQALS
jgi:PHP domain-containing protein